MVDRQGPGGRLPRCGQEAPAIGDRIMGDAAPKMLWWEMWFTALPPGADEMVAAAFLVAGAQEAGAAED